MLFVELCAGSAAVTMRARGRRPPCRYMGGKGPLSRRIVEILELDASSEVLLVDPGPWGKVWQALSRKQGEVSELLEEYGQADDHGEEWKRLSAEPVPDDPVRYAATFLALQQLNWRSKPVLQKGDRWRVAGLDTTMAYGLPGTERFGAVGPQWLPMAKQVAGLDLRRVEGKQCSAIDIEPRPGSMVYIDPPYVATQGYAHDLGREAVVELVDSCTAKGSRVAVSEAEPIPGMRAELLGMRGKNRGICDGKPQRAEWLSVSFEDRQCSLFAPMKRDDAPRD